MLNAMTIDVEDYFHVAAFAGQISPGQWAAHEYRAEANTERVLRVFDDAGIRATFFFLGWVAERSPGLVRTVAAAGHEVACHGYSHQLVFRQGRELFRRETFRAKQHLEDTLGRKVRGYRAASFSITPKSAWALDVLVEAGFDYDSSIAPMRHDIYGWPDGPRAPGLIDTPSGAKLVEFPVMLARWVGTSVPVAGGGYFRVLPYRLVTAGLRNINEGQGQPFFFYLHPWELDPGQPRVAGAALRSRLRHYSGLQQCEGKLRRLVGEFKFGAMEDVLSGLLPAA
jgi:polysaccharide deacetylase family protein (PEP-CTERM system associated)